MTSGAFQTTRKNTFHSQKKIIVGSWIDKEGKEHLIRHDIRFIDSFKFMASSLDALVKNLERDKKIETKKVF